MKNGRYGAYVSVDGINATLPSDKTPETVTLEEAIALIDERAAKGGGKPARSNKKKAPEKKPASKAETAPKKAAAKADAVPKKPVKKAPAKKAAAKPKSDAAAAASKARAPMTAAAKTSPAKPAKSVAKKSVGKANG